MLSKDIQEEVWPTSQKEGIKEDELEAVFKARGETAKDKVDEVDKTKLLELLVHQNAINQPNRGVPAKAGR